ncbi:hypothetical protein GCM10027610_106200 [Dactylosporangium cerinum]
MDGDHLPYPARRRRSAAQALAGAADGTLPATLTRLRDGDRHSRDVALFMALVGRDRPTLLATLTDADPRLQLSARLAWIGTGETEPQPVAQFVADAPADTRMRLYRRIRVRRRADLAEALIDPVRARFGDAEAAVLLPACGAATAARLLPQLTHVLGDRSALTRRFPGSASTRRRRSWRRCPPPPATPGGRGTRWGCCRPRPRCRTACWTCWSGTHRRSRCRRRCAPTGCSSPPTRCGSWSC